MESFIVQGETLTVNGQNFLIRDIEGFDVGNRPDSAVSTYGHGYLEICVRNKRSHQAIGIKYNLFLKSIRYDTRTNINYINEADLVEELYKVVSVLTPNKENLDRMIESLRENKFLSVRALVALYYVSLIGEKISDVYDVMEDVHIRYSMKDAEYSVVITNDKLYQCKTFWKTEGIVSLLITNASRKVEATVTSFDIKTLNFENGDNFGINVLENGKVIAELSAFSTSTARDNALNDINKIKNGTFKKDTKKSSANNNSKKRDEKPRQVEAKKKPNNTNKDNASASANKVVDEAKNVEILKQYKELLDSGVLTQEEFDAKKKQILGL